MAKTLRTRFGEQLPRDEESVSGISVVSAVSAAKEFRPSKVHGIPGAVEQDEEPSALWVETRSSPLGERSDRSSWIRP